MNNSVLTMRKNLMTTVSKNSSTFQTNNNHTDKTLAAQQWLNSNQHPVLVAQANNKQKVKTRDLGAEFIENIKAAGPSIVVGAGICFFLPEAPLLVVGAAALYTGFNEVNISNEAKAKK
jgi:anti-sigma28 factor (negative regulator of flagellin synthesis)